MILTAGHGSMGSLQAANTLRFEAQACTPTHPTNRVPICLVGANVRCLI